MGENGKTADFFEIASEKICKKKLPLPFPFPDNWAFRHVSLLAAARVCPLEADGDAGLAAGGAGEQGQIPVAGGHGFFVVWLQDLLLYHLKGDHLVVHIRNQEQ